MPVEYVGCSVNDVRLDGALDMAVVDALRKSDHLIAFDSDHTGTPSPRTALGAKGIGESATIDSTPAVTNAVMDALAPFGVTSLDPPLTAAKLWAAMHADGRRRA